MALSSKTPEKRPWQRDPSVSCAKGNKKKHYKKIKIKRKKRNLRLRHLRNVEFWQANRGPAWNVIEAHCECFATEMRHVKHSFENRHPLLIQGSHLPPFENNSCVEGSPSPTQILKGFRY